MASRYSRSDKEKWAVTSNQKSRRPPVVLPEADSNALIEANKFTLIGRVTNPHIQKTRALVDFFLQHWSVVGQFTGRDLGPHMFQFTFESEKDLQTILKKAPFHFKRWMLILQRWEPIISDDFPSSISFWIRVHGIPLHYWTEGALHAIGSELGVADTTDVNQGRVRVQVNGLKSLEMTLDITLAGTTKKVELEYEKLEKHCFLCKALSHEKEDCPQNLNRGEMKPELRDINYSRTMENLDAYRRAKDDKKMEKHRYESSRHHEIEGQPRYQKRENYDNHGAGRYMTPTRPSSQRGGSFREDSRISLGDNRRSLQEARKGYREVENRSRPVDSRNAPPPHRTSAALRISHGQTSVHSRLGDKIWVEKAPHSQISHTPPPRPQREPMTASQEVNSSLERRPALERISQPVARTLLPDGDDLTFPTEHPSQERLSALQRIAPPLSSERVPLLLNGVANSDSGRLQEVEVQYMEDTFPLHILNTSGNPSSSRLPAKERLSMPQVSPIRSLSADRDHLAVGIINAAPTEDVNQETPELTIHTAVTSGRRTASAKTAGKRKVAEKAPAKKRVARSPLKGVSAKKRRVTTQNSPRRKPTAETPAAGTSTAATGTRADTRGRNRQSTNPPINLIPAITRQGRDFRSAQNTLP